MTPTECTDPTAELLPPESGYRSDTGHQVQTFCTEV